MKTKRVDRAQFENNKDYLVSIGGEYFVVKAETVFVKGNTNFDDSLQNFNLSDIDEISLIIEE